MHSEADQGNSVIMTDFGSQTEASLRQSLLQFLEVYLSAKILDSSPGSLKMYMLHAKNTRKTKPFEKQILWNLARIQERLIDQSGNVSSEDLIICGFLIEESMKYIGSSVK